MDNELVYFFLVVVIHRYKVKNFCKQFLLQWVGNVPIPLYVISKLLNPRKPPFLITDFTTAFVLAVVVVIVELGLISWIRWKYMDTPFLKAALQIAVGGVLVFLTGIFIGSA